MCKQGHFTLGLLVGCAVGATVGAAVGFLSSDEVRNEVKQTVDDAVQTVKEQADAYTEQVKNTYQYASDYVMDQVTLWKADIEEKFNDLKKKADDLENLEVELKADEAVEEAAVETEEAVEEPVAEEKADTAEEVAKEETEA